MLREPQHERKIISEIKFPVRPEPRRRTLRMVFQQPVIVRSYLTIALSIPIFSFLLLPLSRRRPAPPNPIHRNSQTDNEEPDERFRWLFRHRAPDDP